MSVVDGPKEVGVREVARRDAMGVESETGWEIESRRMGISAGVTRQNLCEKNKSQ